MNFRSLNRNVKIRLIEQFLVGLVTNSIFPFMVIYFSERFGTGITGFLMGANVIIGFIAGFYGGHFADKFGRRTIMLKAEYVRLAASILMAVFSSHWLDWPLLVFAMMTVNAICMGFSRPAGEAMIIDASTPEDRKYIYSMDYWFWNASMLVGSMAGGFFFKSYRFELLLILAALSLATLLLLLFFIQETHVPEVKTQTTERKNFFVEMLRNYRVVMNDIRFKVFIVASLLEIAIQFQSMNYSAVRLSEAIPSQPLLSIGQFIFFVDGYKLYGLLNSVNTVLIVIAGVLVAKITKRASERTSLFGGILLYSLGYAYIAHGTHPWSLLIMMCVVAIGELVYIPRKQAMLAEIVPNDKRGAYMAINGLTFRAASMIGSISLTIGNYLPSLAIGAEILLTGVLSLLFYAKVVKKDIASSDTNQSISY